MREERIIDLKDMLKDILLRWRLLIIAMLVGAVLLDGVSVFQSYRNAKSIEKLNALSEKESSTEKQEDITKLKAALSTREVEEVENAVLSYKTYRTNFLETTDYINNSIRMKIDPNHIPTMTVCYSVDNHYEAVYPVIASRDTTTDIITAYCNVLLNDGVLERICDDLGTDPSYIKELVSITRSGTSSLYIGVIADEKTTCEKICDAITEELERVTPEIQATFGEFDIAEYSRSYTERADAALLADQQGKSNVLYNYKVYLNSVITNMTAEQQAYYYALLDEMATDGNEMETVTEAKEYEMETVTEEKEYEIEVPAIKIVSLKYIVVGLFIGFFIVCCGIILKYVLNNRLHVADEMKEYYKTPVIGILKITKQPARFLGSVDQFILSAFQGELKNVTNENQVKIICANIQVAIRREHMKNVYLTGTHQGEKWQQIIESIKQSMEVDAVQVSNGGSVISDPGALKDMADSDGVVFIEYVKKSKYKDIDRELEICKENNISVIGSVVIY